MILSSIMNLAITWDVFTWSKQAHNIRFTYFFVHLFIMIMHHAFKLFDESFFKDLLSVVSCFRIKGSKFWEHTVFWCWVNIWWKKVLYITDFLLYLWFDLEVCSFPNWRFLRSSITLRRCLLPNVIFERYNIFLVWTKSFKKLKSIYI